MSQYIMPESDSSRTARVDSGESATLPGLAGPSSAEAIAKALDHCAALSADTRATLRHCLLAPRNVSDRRLCGITELLLAELRTPFFASRLAAPACLERQYFSTFFRLHLGINFSRWRRNVRIACAIYLLLTQKMTVPAVARAVGYRTTSEFGRALRKAAGLSPRRLLNGVIVPRRATPAQEADPVALAPHRGV